MKFLDLFAGIGGFRAKLSRLLAKDKGLKTHEVHSFFKLHGSPLFSNLDIYSLKTSKDYYTTTGGATFGTILETLEELGYDVEWQVLNSKHFGVPQNRERVFIVGHSRGTSGRKIFPIGNSYEKIDKLPGERNTTNTLVARYPACQSGSFIIENQQESVIHVKEATKKGYAVATVGDSVNLSHPNSKTRRGRVGKQIANTILTGTEQGIVTEDLRVRKLTPRECWRLQGFPDYAFNRAQQVNSDSQLYKQAGNSVTVNVIEAIAKEL